MPPTVHLLLLGGSIGLAACDSERPLAPHPTVSQIAAISDTTPFYYYDHQPVYLTIDPTHLVVVPTNPLMDAQSVRQAATPVVSALGLQIDSIAPLGPPPFRWLLRFPAATEAGAATARASLASNPNFQAVIPAYRTREGSAPVFMLNRVVARFKNGVSRDQVDSLAGALGALVLRPPVPDSGYVTYILEARSGSATSALQLANVIDGNALALWASPDKIRPNTRPMSVPSDAFFSLQYYLHNTASLNGVPVDINIEPAWDLTKGSASIRVIFIDTGLDAWNPEWSARNGTFIGFDALWYLPNMEPGEWTGQPFSGDTLDEHGTAVAGIALAAHDGVGIAGVAPNVLFDAVRIFRGFAVATDNDIANGITWAAQRGDVLNNSWGDCGPPDQIIRDAVLNAMSTGRGGKGAVVVFSAGNYDPHAGCYATQTWESQIPGVIAVAALARTGARASYSLTGPAIAVSAFGGELTLYTCFNADIVTTILHYNHVCYDGPSGNYTYTSSFGGTSAAAPQVSGVAALLLSREATLTASQVRTRIMANADPWGDPTQFGSGKLNAFRALFNLSAYASGPSRIIRAGTDTWTAHPSGGTGTYTYLWQMSTNNGASWSNEGTGSSLSFTFRSPDNEAFWVRVQVSSGGMLVTSAPVKVTVNIP